MLVEEKLVEYLFTLYCLYKLPNHIVTYRLALLEVSSNSRLIYLSRLVLDRNSVCRE